jgi:hypothetical protein
MAGPVWQTGTNYMGMTVNLFCKFTLERPDALVLLKHNFKQQGQLPHAPGASVIGQSPIGVCPPILCPWILAGQFSGGWILAGQFSGGWILAGQFSRLKVTTQGAFPFVGIVAPASATIAKHEPYSLQNHKLGIRLPLDYADGHQNAH